LCPELLFLGRDYPQGYAFFRSRLHRAFMAKAGLTDDEEIRQGIARADFVRKGTSVHHPSIRSFGDWTVRRRSGSYSYSTR
jgi:hypothetical protein